MPIVLSRGTFVNNDLTSKKAISYPSGIVSCLIFSIKCFVLFIVHLDLLNGDNNFVRCLAKLYCSNIGNDWSYW